MNVNFNDPVVFYGLFFGLATLMGGTVAAVILWVGRMLARGKPWVLILPETPNSLASLKRMNVKDAQITKKHDEEGKTWVTAGEASYPIKEGGAIHVLTEYGANLIAPSKDHVTRDLEAGAYKEVQINAEKDAKAQLKIWAARFRVWDPLLMWRSNRENDMEDLYSAQAQKDPWQVRLAPLLLVAVIFLVGIVGFLMWKVVPLISAVGR